NKSRRASIFGRVSLLKQLSHCFVVPVDIFEEEYLAILLGNRRAIDDQHGNLVCQIYLLFLFCLKRRFNPFSRPSRIISQHPFRQSLGILYANAAMAEIAPTLAEERLGRRRV